MLVSHDSPLAELTLRKYEKPNCSGRELVKKLCLSLGLLQPGDSRDVIVDVLHVLLKNKTPLSSAEIQQEVIKARESLNLPLSGVASSNIRRQLKRLKDMFIIESRSNKYMLGEDGTFTEIFKRLTQFLLPSILGRIREYCEAIDRHFG